jgi:hypothetical protein
MEPTMTFQPGTYYVGDPGFVLPNDDLRMLFAQSMHGGLKSGPRELVTSYRFEDGQMVCDYYWLAATPHKQGTIYDQDNKGWGFDWAALVSFLGNGWTARGRMRATRSSLPSHLSVHLPKTVLQ